MKTQLYVNLEIKKKIIANKNPFISMSKFVEICVEFFINDKNKNIGKKE